MSEPAKTSLTLPVNRYVSMMLKVFLVLFALLILFTVVTRPQLTAQNITQWTVMLVMFLAGWFLLISSRSWVLLIDAAGIHWRAWKKWTLTWEELAEVNIKDQANAGDIKSMPMVALVDQKSLRDEMALVVLTNKQGGRFELRGASVPHLLEIAALIEQVRTGGWETPAVQQQIASQQTVSVCQSKSAGYYIGLFLLVLLGMLLSALASMACIHWLGIEIRDKSPIVQLFMFTFLGIYASIVLLVKRLGNKK